MSAIRVIAAATLFTAIGRCEIVQAQLPDVFKGEQTGIGSWYQADSARDQTNGHSWCGYTYTDSSPLFAPSLKLMGGATYNSNAQAWKQQTAEFCGLEAKVTDPATGKTQLMYIGDSFAQPRSDGSIDIMLGAFTALNGDPDQNKDTVVKNVRWELTGNRNTDWMAPGAAKSSSSSTVDGTNGASNSSSETGTSDAGATTTLRTMTVTASASGQSKTPSGKGEKEGKGKKKEDNQAKE